MILWHYQSLNMLNFVCSPYRGKWKVILIFSKDNEKRVFLPQSHCCFYRRQVMFILINQMHISVQISFWESVKRASSVLSTTARCLTTGNTESRIKESGRVLVRLTMRRWSNFTVTQWWMIAQPLASSCLSKGKPRRVVFEYRVFCRGKHKLFIQAQV